MRIILRRQQLHRCIIVHGRRAPAAITLAAATAAVTFAAAAAAANFAAASSDILATAAVTFAAVTASSVARCSCKQRFHSAGGCVL